MTVWRWPFESSAATSLEVCFKFNCYRQTVHYISAEKENTIPYSSGGPGQARRLQHRKPESPCEGEFREQLVEYSTLAPAPRYHDFRLQRLDGELSEGVRSFL